MSLIQATQCANIASLLNQDGLHDTTFIIGPQQKEFNVNRLFLAAISPVLKAMLFGQMKESKSASNITIEDIDEDAFESVVNFAYCADPSITMNNVLAIIRVSDKYQISSLSIICDEYLLSTVNGNNLCKLIHDSMQLKVHNLTKICQQCIKKCSSQTDKILSSNDFLKMNVESMKVLLRSDYLRATEEEIFEYVLKWVGFQSKYRLDKNIRVKIQNNCHDDEKGDDITCGQYKMYLFEAIKPLIRFGLMDGAYFVNNVKPQKILNDAELVQVLCYFQYPDAGCGSFNISKRTAQQKK